MPDFEDRLAEVVEGQHARFEPYRALCEAEGLSDADLVSACRGGDYARIPAVPADWFKKGKGGGLHEQLADLSRPGQWLVSSSTSGDCSYTWRTDADVRRVSESFLDAYQRVPRARALAFSPDAGFLRKVGQRFAIDDRAVTFYAVVPTETAGAYFQDIACLAKLNLLKTAWAMARSRGKGRPVLELRRQVMLDAIERAEADGTPLVFSASVLMLYPTLADLPRDYRLGDHAYFVTGAGGWDGKKGTMQGAPIHKPTFVADMCARMGISPESAGEHFVDIYGTTENGKAQPGRYSHEHGDYLFEVGRDARLCVIDPISGRPAEVGQQGHPRFISPYGVEGFAGACVQQSDLVTVVSLRDDGSVAEFTGVSRAGDAGGAAAGCAFQLAEGVKS